MDKKIDRTARSVRRYLKRHGEAKELDREWVDVAGKVYDTEMAAKVSSFLTIVYGCFKRGFPVVVPYLFYPAWTFYPFIFIRKDFSGDIISTFGHEAIHNLQQRDIHLTVSLPIFVILFLTEMFAGIGTLTITAGLLTLPFIPTFFYIADWVRTFRNMVIEREKDNSLPEVTLKAVRENTCFEREANAHCMNEEYLKTRKFWGVLAYTGWKRFKNYI